MHLASLSHMHIAIIVIVMTYHIHALLVSYVLRYFLSVVYKDAGTFLYSVNLFESVSVFSSSQFTKIKGITYTKSFFKVLECLLS